MNHDLYNAINILSVIIEGDLHNFSSLFKSINVFNFLFDIEVIVILLVIVENLDFLIVSSFVVEI